MGRDVFVPQTLERQVVIIFAGNEGLLDDVELNRFKDFETGLIQFVDEKYPDIAHEIAKEKKLSDALKEKITKAILEFKGQFK